MDWFFRPEEGLWSKKNSNSINVMYLKLKLSSKINLPWFIYTYNFIDAHLLSLFIKLVRPDGRRVGHVPYVGCARVAHSLENTFEYAYTAGLYGSVMVNRSLNVGKTFLLQIKNAFFSITEVPIIALIYRAQQKTKSYSSIKFINGCTDLGAP